MNDKSYLLKNALKKYILYSINEKNIILNIYKEKMKKKI